MNKRQLRIITPALMIALVLELLLGVPSHPECGTAGVDYMPCDYLGRVRWNVSNGSWMLSLVIAVGCVLLGRLVLRKMAKKSKR